MSYNEGPHDIVSQIPPLLESLESPAFSRKNKVNIGTINRENHSALKTVPLTKNKHCIKNIPTKLQNSCLISIFNWTPVRVHCVNIIGRNNHAKICNLVHITQLKIWL